MSVSVLGQEMVAHSKRKLKSLWKGLFRDLGGKYAARDVKHPNNNRGKLVPPLRLPGQRVGSHLRGTQIMAWQEGGREVTFLSFVL